jgi:DnaJ-class molecular chaperone
VSQLALDALYTCDICGGSGRETDPETLQERPCRVCGGSGTLDYQPPRVGRDAFDGMQEMK